jgi:hypothetical protein
MNEFFNPKVGLRALFSDPHWLAPYLDYIRFCILPFAIRVIKEVQLYLSFGLSLEDPIHSIP